MSSRLPIARSISILRRRLARYRDAGETIALVPTMGALHDGHLALIRRARRRADRVVVSIFVNPAQFAPAEDFSSYPRTFDADVRAIAAAKADLVWAPESIAEMYPPGFATSIVPAGPATVGLEDAVRPQFFTGVATVVAKLLLQCLPDIAVFGEKDFQQLRVVERMVADLNIPTTIVGAATVRERDGLALSSRNVYLSEAERELAPTLYRTLQRCAREIGAGHPPAEAAAEAREALKRAGFGVDYLEARHARTLAPLEGRGSDPIRILGAVKLGNTRLIDNVGVPRG
jgi:pantoate--beta-alanine ligase